MSLFELDDLDVGDDGAFVIDPADYGTLGARRLVAVQVVDVGRLQSEVLPLPSTGGLVAVTGRGPVDSNQSSKTTWEAAVDLLGMSHAWGPRSNRIGEHAQGLILSPDGTHRVHRADEAYVLGGFRAASAGLPPLTVIARIDRASDERLRFRVLDGLAFAEGDTHAERIVDARRLWAEAPAKPTYSARSYLRDFLGGHPRSAGYVNRRGTLHAPPVTLFTAELSKVPADRIALDLLQLTGLDELVTSERRARADAAARSADLTRAEKDLTEARRRIEGDLTDIDRRRHALSSVQRALTSRNAWIAAKTADVAATLLTLATDRQQLLDSEDANEARRRIDDTASRIETLEDRDALQQAVATAKAEVEQLRPAYEQAESWVRQARSAADRIEGRLGDPKLLARAEQATGRSTVAVEVERAEAHARVEELTEARGLLKDALARAQDHYDEVRSSGSRLSRRLAGAGVDAHVLGDSVEVTDAARPLFDPLLSPWSEALVVAPADQNVALELLAGEPGTVVISDSDAVALPNGIAAAPRAARRFLSALADGAELTGAIASVASPPHRIVGGHESPQTGRQARLAAAERQLEQAAATLESGEVKLSAAHAHAEELGVELDANLAAAEREELREEHRAAEVEYSRHEGKLADVTPSFKQAQSRLDEASRVLNEQEKQLASAREQLESAKAAYKATVEDRVEQLKNQARSFDLTSRLQRLSELVDIELPGRVDALEPDEEAVATIVFMIEDYLGVAIDELGLSASQGTRTWNTRSTDLLREALDLLDLTEIDGRAHWPSTVLPAVGQAYQRRLDALADAASRDTLDEDDATPTARLNETFFDLATTLRDWLEPMVELDEATRSRLEQQLEDEQARVKAAHDAYSAELAAAETITSSVCHHIESRLEQIGDAFAARMLAAEGKQATLHVDRIDPRSEAQELSWNVVPAWARHPDDPPTQYQAGNPNTAQEKLVAVQLILAAFASEGPPGRVLLLDELAAGLGTQNFDDVVAALAATARAEGLTVVATIQDTHVAEVVDHVASVLFFRYRAETELLNDVTSVLARGPDGALAEIAVPVVQGRQARFVPIVDDADAWDGHSPLIPDDPSSLLLDLDGDGQGSESDGRTR